MCIYIYMIYIHMFVVKIIFEMLTVQGQQHFLDSGTDVKVWKILRQEMPRVEGDANLQPSDSCRML